MEPLDDPRLTDAFRRRASMEERAAASEPAARTPDEALQLLAEGNDRFFGGRTRRDLLGANERRAQIIRQTPFAAILGCADSRVPVETVFDQGFGDLFVTRVAGNVACPASVGSVEFAVVHLKCRLVVVLGHEGCGAVEAALESAEALAAEPPNLRALIEAIRPAVEGLAPVRDRKARLREAVVSNVRLQVHRLRQNEVVARAEAAGQIRVVGAFYEIGSGAVDFFVSAEDLAL